MLRRARWLILLAIAVILAGVGYIFVTQREAFRRRNPAKSAALPPNISATAEGWTYTKTEGDRVIFRVRAKSYSQVKEPSAFLLRELELEIHDQGGKNFDLVKTEQATFDTAEGVMVADGKVEITMGLAKSGAPAGRVIGIASSKVRYESKTMRVTTDEPTTFRTERANGAAVGADYDPASRELHLHRDVKLEWESGTGAQKKRMQVEAGELVYKETENQILLFPWARLRGRTMNLEGTNAVVFLKEGLIDRVEARQARGSENQPGRDIEYAADFLAMNLTKKGELAKIEGLDGARLVAKGPAARTTVTAKRLDLEFDPAAEESVLTKATANGDSRVESKPVERAGQPVPPTRVLTSEVIELDMRAGGKEIDKVLTHAPGRIDFIPNRAGERKRQVEGERLYLTYAAENALETFRAVNVSTRTETPAKKQGQAAAVAVTRSRDMQADFDPRTGEMTQLEQWPDFQFEEGTRTARAERATLVQARDIITLKTGARMADESGSTSADEIVLEQATGNFAAVGNVTSVRLPEKKKEGAAQPGLLSDEEQIQARAQRMLASDGNRKIRYEGQVLLWQGANRLRGDTVSIDRDAGTLEAKGSVVSQFADTETAAAGKTKNPGFTVIRAGELEYTDKSKLAYYRKDVTLERTGLEVKAQELRAWFREEKTPKGTESKLDRMFADGGVTIVDRTPGRTRRGAGEHTEYYLSDEQVVLTGGNPQVNDSQKGITRGAKITWYAKQDRMIVDSSGTGGAVTRIPKKK